MGTAYAVRKALIELEQMGFVDAPAGGRGKTGIYCLTPAAMQGPCTIKLLAVGEVRESLRQVVSPRQSAG